MRLSRLLAAVFAAAFWMAAAGQAREVPYFSPASDPDRQGFVRIANRSEVAGTVSIEAIDDAGTRFGPVALSIGGGETVHFNSDDLEAGNAGKGLPDGVGDGSGAWRLEMGTDLDVEALAYLRHKDGFLTAVHDVVPLEDGRYRVPFFNPASNWRQVSLLRLTNPGTEPATARIQGIDDAGDGGQAETTVAPGASRTLSAQDLEGMGLGDGKGKWQLVVDADQPLRVMSLLRSPTGHLTNLSTAPDTAEVDGDGRILHRVPLMPAAGGNVQGFVRVINHGDGSGEATVRAIDDSGVERGTLTLALAGRQTVGFNSDDLAQGNAAKGLTGGVSAGEGDWRLEIESDLPIEVLAYARTRDGFVTSLHDAAPAVGRDRHVAVLNPGANWRQVSSLRLVNPGDEMAEVTIAAVDDAGESPGLGASALLPAGTSATWTALELEDGTGSGLAGGIGDGAGKWRLLVTSRQPVRAMSLMMSPTGHLTNLSTSTLPPAVRRVALTADVEVPWGVRGVGAVTVASLGGESAEAPVDGSSSVLVASDEGGTVLLALADEDGGYLDGGSGSVDVGIESTALALAAAASGRSLQDVGRPLADAIRDHEAFGRLVELLTGLMASDKNYLDRLYDYPEAVALVQKVASGAAAAMARPGRNPRPARVKRAFGARAVASGQVEGTVKGDFYCLAENRVVKVVAGVASAVVNGIRRAFSWPPFSGSGEKQVQFKGPCSHWHEWQPWTWYGVATGLESLDINWWSAPIDLATSYYDVAIDAALNGVPFLAVTTEVPKLLGHDLAGRLHAIGNPNYVSFAMEAHTADGYHDWIYVPGNPTALRKLLYSGAAYTLADSVENTGVLQSDIARIQFTRHRFDFVSGHEPEWQVSWMNALDLGLAAANLLTDVSEVRQALRGGDAVGCVRELREAVEEAGKVPAALDTARGALQGGAGDQLSEFFEAVATPLLASLAGAAREPACVKVGLKAVGFGSIAKKAANLVAKFTPTGWMKLALDAANETLPVALGYFSPRASGVTYHLTWNQENDDEWPYISRVSTTAPPAAQFTYEQGSGFEVALDASATEPGGSDDLRFEWSFPGRGHPGGSSLRGERVTYDFGEAGNYRVDLFVTDGNGETGRFSSSVKVTVGRPPTVGAVYCAVAGEGKVRIQADFGDPDGDIDFIEWYARAGSAEPDRTTGLVDEVLLDYSSGTHARVTAVDEQGNRGTGTCRIEGASTPPEPADSPGEVGEVFREALLSGGWGPEMVVVPAGSFRMGCLNDDGDCNKRENTEFPVHDVRIDYALAVSKYEVTFDDYDRFTHASSAHRNADDWGFGRGRRPAINVSWYEAKDYVAWLSSQTGATYRLLSESEWEYAARAGTRTKYSWGNDIGTNRANCDGCGSQWDDDRTAPVGSFAPNPWGLYDMHGNAWEWVEDWWNRDYEGAPSDGSAWTSGSSSRRMVRGGAWINRPDRLRSANRDWACPSCRRYISGFGFRVARELTP